MNNNLDILEKEALLRFVKNNINKESLSVYSNNINTLRYLFLAIIKLEDSVDEWHKSMSFTE